MKDGKLGIALVGLGNYSENELAPALQQTAHCYLAGIVSGSGEKREKWQKQYNLPGNACYSYEEFDAIRDNPHIDIVYVVLPNALHAEWVIRAAGAGKHVICEKPMAKTVAEARDMLKKAERSNVVAVPNDADSLATAAQETAQGRGPRRPA